MEKTVCIADLAGTCLSNTPTCLKNVNISTVNLTTPVTHVEKGGLLYKTVLLFFSVPFFLFFLTRGRASTD